ncbi:PTS system mannose/fructose/N-acetylgalactosamine-transporter subunit IIB [Streptococcus parauberis]|uniref:PTS system mannose/fructose/N-acetylgalactosamine-transporter subunit IIB n=1 Tax=Streptococcus parauberis TaxID=1348 RepID=UPI00020CBCBE|nr:mannose/fructose/sorbose PTS transporter subunit IIB [Streptococcus parauberis]AEF25975.1 PTS system, mannose/fructose/sorbose family, IIB subunit [Streptococcus parauberis KCTC 11537]UWM90814.1 mannose/fructose/sorbose PTS transporter subunit IIB [Streptococcus parauberis]WEM62967.1 mannose/fructose/sorbose PTS transporter subunit IIB [Streptococcus parauberis]GAJ61325.1 PTS system mannose/fructose/sorbose family transporter subunit IIB [Streptococcus parauberis]
MKIKLARIDDRLIHGQVATVWAKEANAERIIIPSDEVANDEIRRTLVKQAAPPGVKVNIITTEKAIKVFQNPKYENDTVFFLFTKPSEVLELVKAGIPIQSINIGGMQYKEGRVQITKAISVFKEDIDAFYELEKRGVKLDCRVVATDTPKDFKALLDSVTM